MPPALHFNVADIDLNRVLIDKEGIRKVLPQRFEMEQLDAIVLSDRAAELIVGYKDVRSDEFWVRGHMPGMPLMPGVVMLESIAQLCSFVTQKFNLLGTEIVGFGGLEEVRFRDLVMPGDRLIVMCRLDKVRRGRIIVCRFQGVVKDRIVVEGILKGVPIPIETLQNMNAAKA